MFSNKAAPVAFALLAVAFAMLLVVPISTAPRNVAGGCGQLFGSQQKADEHRNFWVVVFQEQRQEAVCDDARAARWIYVSLCLAALVAGLGRRAFPRSRAVTRLVLVVLGLLSTTAAVVDGPIVPVSGAAIGSLVLAAVGPGRR